MLPYGMVSKRVDIEVTLGTKQPTQPQSPQASFIDNMSRARQISDPVERAKAILSAKQQREMEMAVKKGADPEELRRAQARERADAAQRRREAEERAAQRNAQREQEQQRRAQREQEITQRKQEAADRAAQRAAQRQEEQQRQIREREEAAQRKFEAREKSSFANAQKILDKTQRAKGPGVPLSSLSVDTDRALMGKLQDRVLQDKFTPLNLGGFSGVAAKGGKDLGHEATSEDRIKRGVKEAEEVEGRLARRGGGRGAPVGRTISAIGQVPSAVVAAMSTGHPAFLSGLIATGGYKMREAGEDLFAANAQRRAAAASKGEDSGSAIGMLSSVGAPALKIAGAGLMAYGALTGSSIDKRLQYSQQAAELELPVFQALMTSAQNLAYRLPTGQRQGVKFTHGAEYRTDPLVDTRQAAVVGQAASPKRDQMIDANMWRRTAQKYGMTPQETAGMLQQFAVGTGVPRSLTKDMVEVLAQSRMQGIGMGALVDVGRLAGSGGGATYGAGREGDPGSLGKVISRIIGSADSMGMRGGRIDAYLQRIAAATGQLAERGFMLSVEGSNELALALNRTGVSEASGMGALRTAQRLQSLGPSTAMDLGTTMFGPLARGVMLAKGMDGAGSLEDFFGNLSNLSKRKTGGLETVSAFRDYLGPEGSLMGLLGAGESVQTAKAALSVEKLVGAPRMPTISEADLGGAVPLSRVFAEREVSKLEEVTIEGTKVLVDISTKLDQMILAFTADDSSMMRLLELVNELLPHVVDIARKL